MKFSDDTINVLKNFSSINPSVMFKEGNIIRTISPQKTVMAAATVQEQFPTKAGVFDLGRFLATVSLFDTPDIEFGSDRFTIKSTRSKVSYTYAAESMIVTPPDRDIPVPASDTVVSIKWEDLQKVIRAAGVLNLSEIAFIGNDSGISIAATDTKNSTADKFDIVVDGTPTKEFQKIIKVDNLKLLPADYAVTIADGLAHFKSANVQYWVAVESK